MKKNILILFLAFYSALAFANLDWGGGQTNFSSESGLALDRDSGYAVLISVRAGQLIDFETFVADAPIDLVTPGAILTEGTSVNYVLAASREFYSGYLLNSAIPDLLLDEQQLLGIAAGEDLYVIVWDAHTFEDGLPTDNSYFTVLPLYLEGNSNSLQAQTSSGAVSFFSDLVYPDQLLESQGLQLLAHYAGFNTYSNFAGWAESSYAIADGAVDTVKYEDSNGNGRSNIEEYAFAVPLTMKRSYNASSGVAGSADVPIPYQAELYVQLRANDPLLAYSLEISNDLKTWKRCALGFLNNQWSCADEAVEVTSSVYQGKGVWSIAVVNNQAPKALHSLGFRYSKTRFDRAARHAYMPPLPASSTQSLPRQRGFRRATIMRS